MKGVSIRRFSGPYFSAFGLNTRRYEVSLCIQSKYGKIRTRKTPNTDTSHAVLLAVLHFCTPKKTAGNCKVSWCIQWKQICNIRNKRIEKLKVVFHSSFVHVFMLIFYCKLKTCFVLKLQFCLRLADALGLYTSWNT